MSFAANGSDKARLKQAQLRQEMLQSLRSLSKNEIAEKSSLLVERLCTFMSQQGIIAQGIEKNFGLFSPMNTEPQIQSLQKQAAQHELKFVLCFPKVNGEKMDFYKSDVDQFEKSSFGVMEPKFDSAAREASLRCEPEVVLVPGLVFHESGQRIGRGRGYYDRYLSERKVLKIGLCFQEQLVKEPWNEGPHDQRMDWIVTDMGVTSCLNK